MDRAFSRKGAALAGVLVAFIWVCSMRVVAATPCCQGADWLLASDDARTAYIDGYIEGLLRGFGQGCLTGTKGVRASAPGLEADPFHKCLSKNAAFPRTTKEYVKSITEFYEKYVADRDLRVSEVLVKLSQGLDLDQIHLQRKKQAETASQENSGLKE